MHKTPDFFRNQGFCVLNVAVKERFETTRLRFFERTPPVYKGCRGAKFLISVPCQSHGFLHEVVEQGSQRPFRRFMLTHGKKVILVMQHDATSEGLENRDVQRIAQR